MDADEIRRMHKSTSIMGFAVIASLILYLVIAEFIRVMNAPFRGIVDPAGHPEVQVLRYVFYGAAILQVVAIRALRARLLPGTRSAELRPTLQRLARISIVTLVLAEVPALLGLVLFLLAGLNRDFYFLLFVSLVLTFLYFPRAAFWAEWTGRS